MTTTIVERRDQGPEPLTTILKNGDHYTITGPHEFMVHADIRFQTGPVKEAGLNGTFVEDLLVIVRDRLEGYQAGQFPNVYNVQALRFVQEALYSLSARTADRLERGVEGTSAA